MRSTQRATLRSIMNVKIEDKIRNEKISEETNAVDVGYPIKKLKYKFAGHAVRMNEERWVKRVINWRPFDRTRSRGRLLTRWRDELEKNIGTD